MDFETTVIQFSQSFADFVKRTSNKAEVDAISLSRYWYKETWTRDYTTFFMLNSVKHELLNTHKYKNIKKFGFYQTQISRECYFPAHKC